MCCEAPLRLCVSNFCSLFENFQGLENTGNSQMKNYPTRNVFLKVFLYSTFSREFKDEQNNYPVRFEKLVLKLCFEKGLKQPTKAPI